MLGCEQLQGLARPGENGEPSVVSQVVRQGADIAEKTNSPWGMAVSLGLNAALVMLNGISRGAGRNIVKSVEPIVSKLPESERASLRMQQGWAAGRLVDQSQGKKPLLPF